MIDMLLTPVGIDIAKSVFQVHHVDADTGQTVSKAIKRASFLQYFSNRPRCLIGMEACGGAQHWARELTKLGHRVKRKHSSEAIAQVVDERDGSVYRMGAAFAAAGR